MHWAAHGHIAAEIIYGCIDANKANLGLTNWIVRLDDFIKMTGNDLLQNAGTVSHQQALKKATVEYENSRNKITIRLRK